MTKEKKPTKGNMTNLIRKDLEAELGRLVRENSKVVLRSQKIQKRMQEIDTELENGE